MVWYSQLLKNFPQFVMIHTVKSFGIVNKAEGDVFLELSCFFDDPADVGNLISGSSAFSKSSLNIWKFMVYILFMYVHTVYGSRLQQYVNHELPDVQAGFRKGRGTGDQIANIHWTIEKSRVPEKHVLLLYLLFKDFDWVDHNKLWKILQEVGIPDLLTCLLRNLYAGQEATVRTGNGTTDCF